MKKFLLLCLSFLLLLFVTGCGPKKELRLKVQIVGEGYLLTEPNKSGYRKGEEVKITAVPHDGYVFSKL
ncbi:MAG: hypothetical protein GX202_01775 [Firmicutes bacterium]|nr:hypothetical protein [Bacillota bacterium]